MSPLPCQLDVKKMNTFSLKTGCPVPCGHQDTHLAKTLSSTCSLPERKKYQHKSLDRVLNINYLGKRKYIKWYNK